MFVHEADKGTLSILAYESALVVACDQGHAWVIQASMTTFSREDLAQPVGGPRRGGAIVPEQVHSDVLHRALGLR